MKKLLVASVAYYLGGCTVAAIDMLSMGVSFADGLTFWPVWPYWAIKFLGAYLFG
jgi:hypothetical protein